MKKYLQTSKFSVVCFALLTIFSALASQAQTATPKTQPVTAVTTAFVRDEKLDSKLMARQMPYNLIVPADYDSSINKTKRFPVVYLLHGLTGHYDNWASRTKLTELSAKYQYIFVMPEGNNGWYSDSATVPNDKYESYIVRELIPEIDRKYRTLADRNHRVIAGLSMGGYGSLKFGLKYPEMFALVGSFSGALQAASFTDKMLGNGWKALTDSIMSVYAAEDSATRRENDIYKLTREMSAEKMKTLPFMYFDCGTEDGLIASNREFAALLLEKKIPHEFRQLPGKHDWIFWNSQIKEFLELTESRLGQTAAKVN